jgi:crotonobetainyl-CoA:carnitine CoA-transferase CaiB-like acyl-CoA transferase
MARIIDMSAHPAVYAARLLAETGNEVIRIESSQGDSLRRLGPYLGDKPDLEKGAYHQFFNAGKQSLKLNLEAPAARRVVLDLIGTADALIASSPLLLEESEILEANPRLVLIKVINDEPELCAVARSGLLALTGHPGQRPVLLGGHVVYAATGLYVSVAAAGALFCSQLTGQGQVVEVSIRQCLESFVEQAMVDYTSWGQVTERVGYRGAITAVSGAFPCTDGYWMVSVPQSPDGWGKFVDWVQDPVLSADASLVDEAERDAKKDLIVERLGMWSKGFSKIEIVTEAQKRHVPAAPVSTPLDLVDDPQLKARGFLSETNHPDFGRILFPLGAIGSLWGNKLNPAPSLGQQNAKILAELGYKEADIQELVEGGAL